MKISNMTKDSIFFHRNDFNSNIKESLKSLKYVHVMGLYVRVMGLYILFFIKDKISLVLTESRREGMMGIVSWNLFGQLIAPWAEGLSWHRSWTSGVRQLTGLMESLRTVFRGGCLHLEGGGGFGGRTRWTQARGYHPGSERNTISRGHPRRGPQSKSNFSHCCPSRYLLF